MPLIDIQNKSKCYNGARSAATTQFIHVATAFIYEVISKRKTAPEHGCSCSGVLISNHFQTKIASSVHISFTYHK